MYGANDSTLYIGNTIGREWVVCTYVVAYIAEKSTNTQKCTERSM